MDQFGNWLVTRASAYQNAYSITADQHHRADKEGGHTAGKKEADQAQTHQNSSGADLGAKTEKKNLYYFHCEREHRLADCVRFKELPVPDRLCFCTQH